jgi:hypothetical protein
MSLQDELNRLKPFIGKDSDEFDKQLKVIQDNFKSEDDLKVIDKFIRSGLNEMTSDLKEFNKEMNLRRQLEEVSQIISLSYVAKNYFHRTRSWLHQRIGGQKVNGKPAKFTPDEINILNHALQDIGKKIGSTVIS